jgi:beta-ketoacyl-acyl-carrier-protein synthase II
VNPEHHPKTPNEKRVVITGMGAVTPLGHNVADTWAGLTQGRSGLDYVTLFDATPLSVRFAGEVKNFDPRDHMTTKEARRMARSTHFAVAAATQALRDAGLNYPFAGTLAERSGVLLGTAMGGFDKADQGLRDYLERGLKINPSLLPAALLNMSTFHLCAKLNALGYSNTTATACAAGTVALVEAAEVIKRGRCDIILAGGTEASILETTMAGFISMGVLSSRDDIPQRVARPFDATRDGFVIGEGCAIFVLERLPHALARGVRIYAEVLGGALLSDTYHMATPDPESKGAIRAMAWALEDAGVTPAEVDYINAHGPGTPLGDTAETRAIKTIFKEQAYKIPISSTKSMVGHAFGAAGAIEAVACVKAIETQIIHPTVNYQQPDPTCDLDYVPNQARPHPVKIALSNSFGLGGQNCCLVLGQYE